MLIQILGGRCRRHLRDHARVARGDPRRRGRGRWSRCRSAHSRTGLPTPDDICPYYVGGKDSEHGKGFWTRIHELLAKELGLKELSPQYWGFYNPQNVWLSGQNTIVKICAPPL